jgi:DNA repair protein RadA/Sms
MDRMTTDFMRASTGMAPLDHVLGGGLAAASVVLLAGPPGIGRTTLSLQMLAGLGHRCLYTSGEETRAHLEEIARRCGALTPCLYVLSERNLATIFTHAREVRAQTIVVDSIQKMLCDDVGGRAGSPTQLKACVSRLVHYAKTNDTAFWLIGHVTSDGRIAGPKAIEHDVDVVLKLTRGPKFDGTERILKCSDKNRFGPTSAVGHFELTVKGFVPVRT